MRRLFQKKTRQHDNEKQPYNSEVPYKPSTKTKADKLSPKGRLFQQAKSSLDSIRTVPSTRIPESNCENTNNHNSPNSQQRKPILSEALNKHYLRLQQAEARLKILEDGYLWDEELKQLLKDVEPVHTRFKTNAHFTTNQYLKKEITSILSDIESTDTDINMNIVNGIVDGSEWNMSNNFSSANLDEIIEYFTTVPRIYELPTRLSKFKISDTKIMNVTETNRFDHLFQNREMLNKTQENYVQNHGFSENSTRSFKDKIKQDSKRLSFQAIKIKDKTNILVKKKQQKDLSLMPLSLSINFESQKNYKAQLKNQKFIKYHLYQFQSNSMILTTNPDIRHTYCKYAPAFDVEILNKNANNFKLVVKDFYNDQRVIMVIAKEGYNYYVDLVECKTILKDNNYQQLDSEKDEENENEKVVITAGETSFFSTDLEMKSLIRKYDIRNIMNRYFLRDQLKNPWLVGSIPRLKNGAFFKMKDDNSKITHKYDTYFFSQENRRRDFQVTLPEPSNNKNIENRNMILACLRPHEKEFSKKFIKDIKRLKNQQFNQENNFLEQDGNDNSTSDNSDNPEGDIFFKPGDGVISKNPPDDLPNKFTLGWLTIYNEKCLENRSEFELVVGMTLASAFEKILKLDNYHASHY